MDTLLIRKAPTVPSPDLEIRISLDRYNSHTLHFSFHSKVIGYTFADFGYVQLHCSPQKKIEIIYEKLGYLTGRSCKKFPDITYKEQNLANLGNELWDNLVPSEVRQAYWKFRYRIKSLLITSDEPWIPWEIVKPYRYNKYENREDSPFWCQQFALSRWLPGPAPADEIFMGKARSIASEKTNLSAIKDEVSLLEELHKLNSNISVLSTLTNRKDFLDWFSRENFSIVHFACHGSFDTTLPHESSIKLADGRLRPSDIQTRFAGARTRPLVFINACHSGRIAYNFTDLGGWAAKLLETRVGLFIGAMWEVTDKLALEFARSFYKKFLKENLTAAEAFRQAREDIRQLAPYDSTWLAYVLYADPNSRVQDLQPRNPALSKILSKLQLVVEAESNIDGDDKVDILEQLNTLTEVEKQPADDSSKKSAKRAMRLLKAIIEELSDSNELVQLWSVAYPLILEIVDL